MADWADDRANKIIDGLRAVERDSAVKLLAEHMRLANEEGALRGFKEANQIANEAIDRAFGEAK